MFAKLKQAVLNKAFGFAFARYDTDHTGFLDKNEVTSLINDVFQLLKINRKISWIETTVIMKMLDTNDDSKIAQDEAFEACKAALAKFGGLNGIAQMAGLNGKTSASNPYLQAQASSQQSSWQHFGDEKSSGQPDYHPPEDIDESELYNLPPVGQNLLNQDKGQFIQQPEVISFNPQGQQGVTGGGQNWENWQ